ncbi:MAG: DUF2442 domain-containing protein [Dyella sp.]|uniref:DUF2442 domain-containing protein n=1 Tax=Dyella sp. TaxID=1869338 RepID=UPI003F7ECCA9
MIKLKAVEPKGNCRLLLRFSDGTAGTYDFAPFIEANTEMTAPLRDPQAFAQYYIELGALAWPNGFDLSAESFYRRLQEAGDLHRDAEAA